MPMVLNRIEGGYIDPQTTAINFAVSNQNSVANFTTLDADLPKEIKPGVIINAIQTRPTSQSFVLSVDGKKLATGLSSEKGNIDLMGFEEGEDTLQKAKDRLEKELDNVSMTNKSWSSLSTRERQAKMEELLSIVSLRIKDLRNIHLTLSKALKRFEKEDGSDWRNPKYVYAISSVQSHIYQIRTMAQKLLHVHA